MMGQGKRLLQGLWVLLRPVPVLAWSGGACLMAVGLVWRGGSPIAMAPLVRLILVAGLIQGWLAHSLNDLTDWQSGTDVDAQEIWSGGSGVLRIGYLGQHQLLPIAYFSVFLVLGLVFSQASNYLLYVYLLIGLWGAIAYSQWPWRLSYVPLLGEWLAAFPAIVACSLAFYQGLQDRLDFSPWAEAVLHGLLSVAWLMQHHLPDWQRDLQAKPAKRTTVAYVAARFGGQAARLVVVAYCLLALFIALNLSFSNRRFLGSALAAGCGACLAYHQNVSSRQQMARRELQILGINLLHAWALGWLL